MIICYKFYFYYILNVSKSINDEKNYYNKFQSIY